MSTRTCRGKFSVVLPPPNDNPATSVDQEQIETEILPETRNKHRSVKLETTLTLSLDSCHRDQFWDHYCTMGKIVVTSMVLIVYL